jgi:hypothetical protein
MTTTNNENKKGTSSRQQRSDNIKSEYIQKLSNEKALAEAILIGNKPCFAVVDFSDLGTGTGTTIGIMDSLAYSQDTRLKPELLSNRPYLFKNREEFDSYIQKAENERLDSLFDRTLSLWKKYIDADDFHLKICAADTIFTYFQDRVGMTHYLFFVADNDAGKSNNLLVFNILGYRNLMSTSMTYANVYNFLGDKDEGVGTICYDEADNIDENHDIMGIFKEGYTTGHPVVRTLDTVHGKRQLKLNTFCFKAYAGEKLPDALTGKGFMQRTLELRCLPGYPEYDISEIINTAGDEEFEELLGELNDLRNTLLCYRLIHCKDKIPNIKLNIRNREKQLFKPVLRVFQGTRTFDILRPVISKYIKERRQKKINSYHAFLYRIIRDLISAQNTLELQSNNIWNFLKMNLEWKDIPYKPQSIETVEFGVLSLKGVIQTLKEVFHAEPPRHIGSTRSLVFSQDVLDRMRDTYDIDIEIKVDFETHETLETLFVGISKDSNHSGDTANEENDEGINENYEEKEIESNINNDESAADTSLYSQNVSQVSQASQTQQRWPVGTPEQAEAFREEVARIGTKGKSKAAEIAEANQAGDGVMFGNLEEPKK